MVTFDTEKFYDLESSKDIIGKMKPNSINADYFFGELRPIVHLAEWLNKSSIEIKFSDQKRADDGILRIDGKEQQLQYVWAKDGQQEQIRAEHIRIYGSAPAVQDMEWNGSKHKREIPKQKLTGGGSSREWMQQYSPLINSAIDKKLKDKYKGMWLCVTYDHWLLGSEDDKKMLDELVEEKKNELKKIYHSIIFQGENLDGRSIIKYDL